MSRRELLNKLTIPQLRQLSTDRGIPQKSKQTKIGFGSVIMSFLTKEQIVREVEERLGRKKQ
uniref:Uncharacterized protein n=1 Tax=Marseillevirus LCMAC202 TaxID=2506606 RepID=A0A481Z0A1_9VIRU|nr:MAG: hypothetical protein LCMAC202_04680 [Marseillevirus LCMAC202]